jgi:hypothetical protein
MTCNCCGKSITRASGVYAASLGLYERVTLPDGTCRVARVGTSQRYLCTGCLEAIVSAYERRWVARHRRHVQAVAV